MDNLEEAFNQYAELATQAHKLENEVLALPKSAAEKIGVNISLLTVVDSKRGLFMEELLKKLKELKDLEAKRDEARRKFVQVLKR